jgi:hypothetical protein
MFLDEFARTGLRGKPVRNAVLGACCLARWHSVLLSVILVAAGKLSPVEAGHAPAGHEYSARAFDAFRFCFESAGALGFTNEHSGHATY